jgi:ABC-type nitrate/sulfonate/bicarbonate transport system substrate-binding protein
MNKKVITVIIIIAVVLVGIGALYFEATLEPSSETSDSVIVAYSPFESGALFWIAKDQHYFEENGINLTLIKYDSGAASLDGVIKGEADIAVGVTEFPLVRKALQNERVRAIGNIDKGEFIYLVARKDRIRNETDLKGMRVGTTAGTVAEFHLGRFLTLHGMTLQDITLVDVKTPAGWVNDVADGKIDAISTAQPYANAARDRLGTSATVWPLQSSQPLFALAVSSDDWITQHPDVASRFLRSLAQAEEYIHVHPAESRAIVQNQLDLDAGYMDTVWQQNQFSLTLDQSLVLAMEDEARWMIANNLTNATVVPDFRQYIYTDGLESVRPGSVNIIR